FARAIHLPVVRVPLENDSLAGHIFLETKWAQTRHLRRCGSQSPRLCQTTIGIHLLEKVLRQNRNVIEQPLCGGVRLGEVELDRVPIELANAKRLSSDDEQIALRRSNLLVQVHLEREQHIIGIEGMPVGEAEPSAQRQNIPAAVA